MFKFIKQYTERMEHVSIYPLISLLIFFIFFIVLLWYVFKIDKQSVKTLSGIPLQDEGLTAHQNL